MVKIKWFPIFVESGSHDPNITYFPPETAFKYLTSIRSDSQFLKCPALRSFLKNTFIIKSPYNYRLEIDPATKGINADRFGKEFFENNIGEITKMYYPGAWFDLKYTKAPDYIIEYMEYSMKGFNVADILIKSKNKQECEAYLAAKKYNI